MQLRSLFAVLLVSARRIPRHSWPQRSLTQVTTAIIRMTKTLNLKVLAEGVENEVQLAFLRQYECDEIQGYYFSKPLSGAELEGGMLALSI